MNYVECRESSLLLTKEKQVKFMNWINYKLNHVSKFCVRFLNFLTWDRIGLVIQTARIRRIHFNISRFSAKPLKALEIIKSIIDLYDVYPAPQCTIETYIENATLKKSYGRKKLDAENVKDDTLFNASLTKIKSRPIYCVPPPKKNLLYKISL